MGGFIIRLWVLNDLFEENIINAARIDVTDKTFRTIEYFCGLGRNEFVEIFLIMHHAARRSF